MMKLLARHDTLIAIIGTAVLTGVYYLGVICPGHSAARDIKAELAQTHARMAELPALMLEQTRLQSQLDGQRETLAQVEIFRKSRMNPRFCTKSPAWLSSRD
jgi:type II secretory pathway component PulM